jgi:hypothetical protein
MKRFHIVEKRDAGLVYALELASSISVLLLAFGLMASMGNVLTKSSVLTDHPWMPA